MAAAEEAENDNAVELSRYVTVFYQIRETESGEPGDRFLVHGKERKDRFKLDEDAEDFVKVAKPIAVIDVGVEITDDDVEEWCNSHAGQAVLSQYFPETEPDDPTLDGFAENVNLEGESGAAGGDA